MFFKYLEIAKLIPTKSHTNDEYLFEKKSVLLCMGKKHASNTFKERKKINQFLFEKYSFNISIDNAITMLKNKTKPTTPVSERSCRVILCG